MVSRNIEIKAVVRNFEHLKLVAADLSNGDPEVIHQDDTFFLVQNGRLKLRTFADGTGELIFYDRPDVTGPKASTHCKSPTTDPDSLRTTLQMSLGAKGRVVKERLLYLVGQTRVHVDKVEGLEGHYMELEVCLREDETLEEGQKIAEELMEKLGVSNSDLILGAYLDLLQKNSN